MKPKIKRCSLLPLAAFCATSLMAHPYNDDLSVQDFRSNLDQVYQQGQINYKQYLLNHVYAKDNNRQVDVAYFTPSDKINTNNADLSSYALTFDMLLLEKDIQVLTQKGYINLSSEIQQVNIPEATTLLNTTMSISPENDLQQIHFLKGETPAIKTTFCQEQKCRTSRMTTLYDVIRIEYIPGAKINKAPYTLKGGYHIKIKTLPLAFLDPNSEIKDIQLDHPEPTVKKSLSLFLSLGADESPFIFFSQNKNDCQLDYAKALSSGVMNEDSYYQSLIKHQVPQIKNNQLIGYKACQSQLSTPDINLDNFSEYAFDRAITQLHKNTQEFIRWTKKSAQAGDSAAQYNLGILYSTGQLGVEKNWAEGIKWYKKSAEQNFLNAILTLAEIYRHGEGSTEKDVDKALFWYKKAAATGEAKGQLELAKFYMNIDGDPTEKRLHIIKRTQGLYKAINLYFKYFTGTTDSSQQPKLAGHWFLQAAEQKDPAAQTATAEYYFHGIEGQPNYEKSLYWYTQAGHQNQTTAIKNLINFYDIGFETISKNSVQYLEWLTQFAEQGDALSQYNLAVLYENGMGVRQDKNKAFELYSLAAEQGLIIAFNNLGTMYQQGEGTSQDYTQAIKWYKKGVKYNNANAQKNLASAYRNGTGVTRDYNKAIELLELAANQGIREAQYDLGVMYQKGQGVSVDYHQAFKWFKAASDQGFGPAMHNLGVYYQRGLGVSQDYARGTRLIQQAAHLN